MIAEAPFLFSIAALSASLAGLAGLVAGLRRAEGLRPLDAFRLREIVEFAFANALLALSVFPLVSVTGSVETTARVIAAAAAIYLVTVGSILLRRMRRADIGLTTWIVLVAVLDGIAIAAMVAALITGSMAALEILFIALLARPMTVFLFVLASFDPAPLGQAPALAQDEQAEPDPAPIEPPPTTLAPEPQHATPS